MNPCIPCINLVYITVSIQIVKLFVLRTGKISCGIITLQYTFLLITKLFVKLEIIYVVILGSWGIILNWVYICNDTKSNPKGCFRGFWQGWVAKQLFLHAVFLPVRLPSFSIPTTICLINATNISVHNKLTNINISGPDGWSPVVTKEVADSI